MTLPFPLATLSASAIKFQNKNQELVPVIRAGFSDRPKEYKYIPAMKRAELSTIVESGS